MPSFRCQFLDKWLHKGQISQEEYDAVIKKLDGHNKQIRNDAIEEFANALINGGLDLYDDEIRNIWEIAERIESRGGEMSNEICLNPAFADDDSIEDFLNQEYEKGYEQGKVDKEKELLERIEALESRVSELESACSALINGYA